MSDYNIPVSGGVNGLNVPLHGHIAVYNKEFPVIPNPEGEVTGYVTKLGFTPEILQVKDPEVHDWARAEEKPTYTKAEVGLGNVNNTSDLDKPISTATQTALDGKVDKVHGKALSTNDYTDTDKTIVDGVTSALATKVDKIAGKGLSSNDYTDYEKTKLAYIQSGAEVNVQADWFEANRWSDAFILNKPTKLSDFSNDTGFITSTVDNLTYYYKKSETYTQAEVNALIGSIVTISFLVVQTLPQTGEANIIYLVPADEPNPDNIYEEYIYVNNAWEMIGTTKVDLSNYYTKTETDNLLSAKANSSDLSTVATSGSYDDLTDKPTIDTAISPTSTNAVENRVVKSALDEKLNADETAVNSNGLVIATPVTDTAPYIYRQTPVKESFKALMKKIVGASIVWNQLCPVPSSDSSKTENGVTFTDNRDGSYTVSTDNNGATADTTLYISRFFDNIPKGTDVILYKGCPSGGSTDTYFLGFQYLLTGNPDIGNGKVYKGTSANYGLGSLGITVKSGTVITTPKKFYPQGINLTSMFGTTIADYVNTLETSQSGSGIAWLQSYSFFTEDYAYKQNKLESGCVSAHKTYDGETLLTNTELSPITLRGLFKLSTDKLTVDGDEYNADGSVTRKYEQRAYQSGDESLANAITDGTNTIVKLATPTTEQATPFTETEIVGSTEEFIDYEVAQGNRDVDIPVGTETDYYQEMKLPSLPTTSGNHNLFYNAATGFGWS